MNSASKAIIIAGGFLIGMFIISISMYMLTAFRDFYDKSMDEFEAQQIMAFNSFFTQYPKNIKGYDAYNIIGKVNEINADEDGAYSVYFGNGSITTKDEFYFTENLKNDYEYTYSYDTDGVINTVRIVGAP